MNRLYPLARARKAVRKSGRAGLMLALALAASAAWATWYDEGVEDGADLMMMDLRWPWWPSETYYANWNCGFNPKPNNIKFYAGFTAGVPHLTNALPNLDEKIQAAFRPGSVWTFWGSSEDGTPVRFTDVAPNLFIRNEYGGEGSSGTMGGEGWPFVKNDRWYTMLARVWQPVEETSCAYVGRWIKDLADGRWHLIGVARLPIPATSFAGNNGFIEPIKGKGVRPLHRRFGFFRKDDQWRKSDTLTIKMTGCVAVNTVAEDDHEYLAIEYCQFPAMLPLRLNGKPPDDGTKHEFRVRQPDRPALDKPAVEQVAARTTGRQVAVSWSVPDTASPPLSYRIEVFDNPACLGDAKAVKEARMPNVRHALLDVAVPSPTIRLTIKDVFDQEAPAVIVSAVADSSPPGPAPFGAKTVPGLAYELFHQDSKRQVNYFYESLQKPDEAHHWLTLDEIGQGTRFRRGLARGLDLGVCGERAFGYALIFNGLLRAPADGLYILYAQIDGGYRIQIDGSDVLARDGQLGTTEQAAVRRLSRGDHPLVVTHVYDQLPARNFILAWEGPDLPRQPIPLEALRVAFDETSPRLAVKGEAPGDGTGRIAVDVDGRGHAVVKTILFLDQLQLAETNGPALRFHGSLPQGTNTFWARAIFDENHSVDCDPVTLNVTGKPVDPGWTARNVGDQKASFGLWPAGPESFRFVGNGMHTVTRRITGDFTATCRIDAYNGSRGEPVNPRAWVGVAAFERGERLNWNWGRFFYLVQTAAGGLRTSADFTDYGATRISSYELPKDRPWLRIVRQGPVWTAWTSSDGKHWELGGYQFKRAQPAMDVGLFFSALPQKARAHFHAAVSSFSIVPGVVPDAVPPMPALARHTDGERLTGVTAARSDARVAVVRASALGLLRTTDGGATWAPANGQLTGAELAVRSVAINPVDPLDMLRACGRGDGGGSLWRTRDGGRHWEKLPLDGDFDGVGPSALCGEVVAFDLREPHTLYAGCESKGFFKSTDDGASWSLVGLAGSRITAVTLWPWERYYPPASKGQTHLCVTTCPDHWMTFLGRGTPSVATPAGPSRSFISTDNVATLQLADERDDTGFFNVAYDKAVGWPGEMRYATAHGYQTTVFKGAHMALYPEPKNLEWFRPITALSAAAKGDQHLGRFITQALDPQEPGRLSRSEAWGFEWSWLPIAGAVPAGGLIAACADLDRADTWWFVYTDGLYHSTDGGGHMSKLLDESGRP